MPPDATEDTRPVQTLFPSGRSCGVTVVVDGFFAFVWFGWGQADAPSWLVIPLAVGTGLAVALAGTGVVVTRRSAGALPAMSDPAVRRRYGIVVGLEFTLLGVGAGVLGGTGHERWIPVLICFGVGVHFFPLASTLQNPSLRPLGALLIAVAAAALGAGLASAVAPSTVTGPGAGLCLLGFGVATLLRARSVPAPAVPGDDGVGLGAHRDRRQGRTARKAPGIALDSTPSDYQKPSREDCGEAAGLSPPSPGPSRWPGPQARDRNRPAQSRRGR
jgi:hypothetical protein